MQIRLKIIFLIVETILIQFVILTQTIKIKIVLNLANIVIKQIKN